MVKKCSAYGCRSNYAKEDYTSVFKFPKDPERRQLWVKKISRESFTPSDTAVVCIKHFEERFVIREDRVRRADGSELVVPRTKIGLTNDAYPSIFKDMPHYFNSSLPPARKLPSQRQKEFIQRDEEEYQQWISDDNINTFQELLDKCKSRVNENWITIMRSGYVLFFILDETDTPKINVCFKIFSNLTVEIYFDSNIVDICSFNWLLGSENKCDKWSKFDNLLSTLSSYETPSLDYLLFAIKCLKKCTNDTKDESVLLKLNFLIEQIELVYQKQIRYSTDWILWCCKIYFSFPSAYILIRNSNVMTLPHPSHLRKLTHLCSPTYSSESHVSHLKSKCKLLGQQEKTVNLLLDEIYVNPSYCYKAGRLIGISENSNSAATTVQAFMITSITSNSKDIVALYPIRNLTANILLEYTKRVLSMLHNCGFTVLTLISDNNRVNRNMFTLLCGGTLRPFINNPNNPDLKLFFLFDTVHIIKCIRNNWLKQSILYTQCPRDGNIIRADIKHLEDIYEKEKKQTLKMAPKLSHKTLYPNSIEKQNVQTALNLFHESNIVTLEMYGNKLNDKNMLCTKQFTKLISDWWKVVNVKHALKGKHLNDDKCNPITSLSDSNVEFLEIFCIWLRQWLELYSLKAKEKKKLGVPGRGGFLSKETFYALNHSTQTLVELIKYMFKNLGMSYILLGKFQTDSIEARFGQYRQMSGGNYNVSCAQIMETEKKLRILNLLSLHSEKKGKFQISDFKLEKTSEGEKELEVPEIFYEVFNSKNDTEISEDTLCVLIYIAGYVAYKVSHVLKCVECISLLIKDKTLELDCPDEVFKYLLLTDRGQLKWPQQLLVFVMQNAYQIFQKLIGQDYENLFLKFPEPKCLIIHLTMEKIEILGIDYSMNCSSCGKQVLSLIKQCLSGISNVFLNNYTKVKNDKQPRSTKRKLDVLANV